jgi:hypothetical protein
MENNKNLKSYSEFEKIWEAEVSYHSGSPKADQAKIDVLENKLKEYWGISSDIDAITKEIETLLSQKLGALPDKLKGAQQDIERDIETLNIQKIKTDKVVATFRKAYKQPTVSYKPMWETALTKVNENTRNILEALISQFTKETEVKQKIDIKRESIGLNEGILDTIKGYLKKGSAYVLGLFKGGLDKAQEHLPELEKSTSELADINNQIAGHEEGKANREAGDVHGWQADQYEAKKVEDKKEKGYVILKDVNGTPFKAAKKGWVEVSGTKGSTFKKIKK